MRVLAARLLPFTVVSVALCSGRSGNAQVVPHPDSATIARASYAETKLVYWVESTGGHAEQAVFLRNTSTEPIQVTDYEIYDCVNLRGKVCGVHSPGPLIAPGKTVRIVVIDQGSSEEAWSFRYRFHATFLHAPNPAAADSVRHLGVPPN
jgi:hypothetical protein